MDPVDEDLGFGDEDAVVLLVDVGIVDKAIRGLVDGIVIVGGGVVCHCHVDDEGCVPLLFMLIARR
jgi:hypothetical protein